VDSKRRMTINTEDIIDIMRKEEGYLRNRYFIKHLKLFGSFAKNKQRSDSDLDILYTTIPNGTMTLSRLKSFENYLSQLLKIDKIELVSTQSINPVIAKNIEPYAISIF